MAYKVLCFVFFLAWLNINVNGICYNDESCLLEYLLKNKTAYNPLVRPVHNSSNAVNVYVNFTILSLLDIDETKETMTVIGHLWTHWVDEFLQWDPDDFGGIKELTLPATTTWLPDFAIINSVDSFYMKDTKEEFYAVAHPDGTVHYFLGGVFKSSCNLSVKWFPFDTQLCYLQIESWHYSKDQVQFLPGSVILSKYENSSLWDLTNADSQSNNEEEYIYSQVSFAFKLRRKTRFYVVNFLLPPLLISCLTFGVFLLPASSGDKVGLGTNVLLALSVYQLIVMQSIPANSEETPAITKILLALMFLSMISILNAVLVVYIFTKDPRKPPPKFLHQLCENKCCKLLSFWQLPKNAKNHPENEPASLERLTSENEEKDDRFQKSSDMNNSLEAKTNLPKLKTLKSLQTELTLIRKILEQQNQEHEYSDCWQNLAECINRVLFFLTFLCFTCYCIFAILI